MSWMFCRCNKLTSLDVSHFNTSKVTYMSSMFNDCSNLTNLDLSSFNTSKVYNIHEMFEGCSSLTSLDLSSFNTANLINMDFMFIGCSSLTKLDLSSFNTANVKYMYALFYDCSNLQTIYVGEGWSTAAVDDSRDMFFNCNSLVGGQGTTYNSSHIDKTYAHVDGGPSNPGYFTAKNIDLRGDVDGDNDVTIADVSALIDYLLTGDPTGVNLSAANCDGDIDVSIADVSALIDYLLTGSW